LADVAFADRDILGKIAGVVAHGILKAMLLILRVEVAGGCLEVRGIAERFGVDVDAVFADGQILEVELDGKLVLLLLEGGGARVFSGAGLERNDERILRRFGESRDSKKAQRKCGERIAHG
jgi:hypothetical protein